MSEAPKMRVLFVCIGNSCRSQMAEGFARAYGADAVIAASAGLNPAMGVAPDTQRAMMEKNIDLRPHFPKSIKHLGSAEFDVVVNISGFFLPQSFGDARMLDWEIDDPVGLDYAEHCVVRDEIERLVMSLIMELRRNPVAPKFRGQGSGRLEL